MDFDVIKKMYIDDGLSASEIGVQVDMTVWQVIRILKKNFVPRRKASETISLKFNRSSLSYKFKQNLNDSERSLWHAGLMLYWAEGYKAGTTLVDFANSDTEMVQVFLRLLREIYQVDEDRIKIYLYCYANQNPESLVLFWSNLLKISEQKFSKPYVRNDFKLSKIGKMRHGLVHVRYSDKRLLEQIKLDIDKIVGELSRNTQAVNEVTL